MILWDTKGSFILKGLCQKLYKCFFFRTYFFFFMCMFYLSQDNNILFIFVIKNLEGNSRGVGGGWEHLCARARAGWPVLSDRLSFFLACFPRAGGAVMQPSAGGDRGRWARRLRGGTERRGSGIICGRKPCALRRRNRARGAETPTWRDGGWSAPSARAGGWCEAPWSDRRPEPPPPTPTRLKARWYAGIGARAGRIKGEQNSGPKDEVRTGRWEDSASKRPAAASPWT